MLDSNDLEEHKQAIRAAEHCYSIRNVFNPNTNGEE